MKKGVRNRIVGVGCWLLGFSFWPLAQSPIIHCEKPTAKTQQPRPNSHLKHDRSQDHIHPPVHNSAHVGVILVYRILQSPIFDVYHFFRYVFFD